MTSKKRYIQEIFIVETKELISMYKYILTINKVSFSLPIKNSLFYKKCCLILNPGL